MKPRPPPQPAILPVLKPFPAMTAYGTSDYFGQQCGHVAHGGAVGKRIRRKPSASPGGAASRVSSHKHISRIVLHPILVQKCHHLLDKTDLPVVLLLIPNVRL